MATDDSEHSRNAGDSLAAPNHEPPDWGLRLGLTLAVVALVTPYCLIPVIGIYWGTAVAIGIWLIWCVTMPISCMNGGLIYSVIALTILGNTLGLMLGSIIRLTVSLFR